MTAYSQLQEKEFSSEALGYEAVKHQRFVGTGYFDMVTQVIASGNSSTTALAGSTEAEQFAGRRVRDCRRSRRARFMCDFRQSCSWHLAWNGPDFCQFGRSATCPLRPRRGEWPVFLPMAAGNGRATQKRHPARISTVDIRGRR